MHLRHSCFEDEFHILLLHFVPLSMYSFINIDIGQISLLLMTMNCPTNKWILYLYNIKMYYYFLSFNIQIIIDFKGICQFLKCNVFYLFCYRIKKMKKVFWLIFVQYKIKLESKYFKGKYISEVLLQKIILLKKIFLFLWNRLKDCLMICDSYRS